MPARRLWPTSPTGALTSVFSASGRSQRPEGLAKHYHRLRPHVSDQSMQRPYSLLFSDWRNQSRLGPTGRGRPPGRDQGTNGESKARRSSQTMIPGRVPCTHVEIVFCNLPDTNSIVGTDIFLYSIVGAVNSHTVRPPTCL